MPAKYFPTREIELAVEVGFITKKMWREFFPSGGLRNQQARWKQMREDGVFRAKPDAPHVYLPNKDHPLVNRIAEVPARGPILTQLEHDELVARTFYLLKQADPSLEILTEARLKREEPIRNKGGGIAEYRKHPDLVFVVSGERIAVEIEINQKSRRRYQAILRTHRANGFSKIIYLVRSPATKRIIQKAADEIQFPLREIPIGFGSIGEVRKNPSETPIRFTDEKHLLKELLR